MAVLVEGQKFGLSSKSEKSKSVVFVKLTDSSLKSLEDYLKHRGVFDKSEQGPTISFTADNRGEITLPSAPNAPQVSYSFGVSREDVGGSNKQGSFDCISGSSSQSSLQSMGTIREKLHVQASNDVYERIGQRIHDAKIQEEKRSTVLLDDKKDKKSTVPRPNVVRKAGRTVPPPRPAPTAPRQLDTSAISNLHPSSGSSWTGPGRGGHRTAHPSAQNNGAVRVPPKKPSSPIKAGSVRPPSPNRAVVRQPISSSPPSHHYQPQAKPVPPVSDTSVKREKSHPAPVSDPCVKREKSHPVQKPSINPEIMKRPLRERLIHLLAVRPYKKPELLLRMNKDGIKEKEKKNITNMLKSIVSMKDNSYHLYKHIWNEVREDWPFFTEEERNMLKRRKPQNLTPESDTGSTSSGHSPSSTNPASPPQITSSLKRHSYYDPNTEPNPKKKRVSLFKRDIGPGRLSGFSRSPNGEISPPSLGRSLGDSPPRAHEWGEEGYAAVAPGPVVGRSTQSAAPRCSPAPAARSPAPAARSPAPAPRTSSPHQPDPVKIEQGAESEGENNENSQSQPQLQKPVDNNNKDFVTAYTTILSVEQRMKYKMEFNEHYNNYRKLHSILDRVSKRFAELEDKLKLHPRDSPEFKRVQAQIVSEYAKNKQDADYQNARHQFQYLHEKLAHIKLLVHNYDTNAVPR